MKVKNVIINYENGETREVKKGLVCELVNNEKGTIKSDFFNIGHDELALIFSLCVDLGTMELDKH